MAKTFASNPNPVQIPASPNTSGIGNPYPSSILVSGQSGNVTRVSVTLKGLSHTWPDDIDILLVAPDGTTRSLVMSDTGGVTDLTNLTLAFDDAATGSLPDSNPITGGLYKPTDFETTDVFPAPAPAGPYTANFRNFRGISPNGEWRLYINDDAGGDTGTLVQGWELTLFHGANPLFGDTNPNTFKLNKNIVNTYAGDLGGDTYELSLKRDKRKSLFYSGNKRKLGKNDKVEGSSLKKLDHITDFNTDFDRFSPSKFKGIGKDFGTASSVNRFKPSRNKLKSYQWGYFRVGSGESERTFMVFNNKERGFQKGRDGLVEITGYTGSTSLSNVIA